MPKHVGLVNDGGMCHAQTLAVEKNSKARCNLANIGYDLGSSDSDAENGGVRGSPETPHGTSDQNTPEQTGSREQRRLKSGPGGQALFTLTLEKSAPDMASHVTVVCPQSHQIKIWMARSKSTPPPPSAPQFT